MKQPQFPADIFETLFEKKSPAPIDPSLAHASDLPAQFKDSVRHVVDAIAEAPGKIVKIIAHETMPEL